MNTTVAFCEKCGANVYTIIEGGTYGENEFAYAESCEECGHIIREWN